MSRSFNIGGPCDPSVHYMLDPIARLPRELPGLITQRAYFVLHAPRQTGKTTSLKAYAQKLTAEGKVVAALVSMQPGAGLEEDIGAAEEAILRRWRSEARSQLPAELQPPEWAESSTGARIGDALSAWAEHCPRPLVLFLDEIDALEGATLRSVLHQIRAGHPLRPGGFPSSMALVGLRDLNDYKFASGSDHPPRRAPSPFNIVVRSLTLDNFTQAEIAQLYAQHTAETGQVFSESAVEKVFELTQGQPWLVNALAMAMVEDLVRDPSITLTPAHVEQARELLMVRRDMHLRTLAERVTDARVRTILEPVLSGQPLMHFDEDDLRYTFDLGLLKRGPGGILEISNPIYHAALLNALMRRPQESVPYLTSPTWMKDGRLDLKRLLESFLEFWRQHGSALLATVDYPELAPHLVVLAFMQRVVNGGGKVEREVAVERGRMDVLVQHGEVKLALELKVWRPHQKDPLEDGLAQLERYMRHINTTDGWLFIFDRREGLPRPIERFNTETATSPGGFEIVVVRS